MADDFSERYGDLLTSSCDCADRIVLNACFPLGHNPGGFRCWWRRLHGGSDDQLDDTGLMRFAGRFARRVKARGQADDVPVIYCKAGEREHLIAEEYLTAHPPSGPGVFMILAAKAPATVREVRRSASTGMIGNIAKIGAYVNRYSFRIMDRARGHVTIRPGPGRPGDERVPLQLLHLPGRVQPQPAVPLRCADGGPVRPDPGPDPVMTERFATTLDCAGISFITDGTPEELPRPSRIGATRTGGIDLNRPRIRAALSAALALAAAPHGFTAAGFTAKVSSMSGQDGYTIRRGACDLRKLRGKNLAAKPGRTRRYHIPAGAARTIAALLALHDHVIAPVIAGIRSPRRGRKPAHRTTIDRDYETLRIAMQTLFHDLGITTSSAAAA